jgi:hypothetical protein
VSEFEQLRNEAVQRLGEALGLPPAELGKEVDAAERHVAKLRDHLIQLRREGKLHGRSELDKVNGALSLIVGVEYPVGGIQRKALEQASEALKQVAVV